MVIPVKGYTIYSYSSFSITGFGAGKIDSCINLPQSNCFFQDSFSLYNKPSCWSIFEDKLGNIGNNNKPTILVLSKTL